MTETDKHEWASGVHAGLYTLSVAMAAIYWHSHAALFCVLLSQVFAYAGRFFAMAGLRNAVLVTLLASLCAAAVGGFIVLDVAP